MEGPGVVVGKSVGAKSKRGATEGAPALASRAVLSRESRFPRPWENEALSPPDRFALYKQYIEGEIAKLTDLAKRLDDPQSGDAVLQILCSEPGRLARRRVADALGKNVAAFARVSAAKAPKQGEELARHIVAGLRMSDGVYSLQVPRNVDDMTALRALDRFAANICRQCTVYEHDFGRYQALPSVVERDISQPRTVKLVPVVENTEYRMRSVQGEYLDRQGMRFAEPIEQALLALAYACKTRGGDLFNGRMVRGTLNSECLMMTEPYGLRLLTRRCDEENLYIAASGALVSWAVMSGC